jgi:predicted CoA-binding protein
MAAAASINAFIKQPALAIVGVSRSGRKFGNFARRVLVSKGYRVYPIHPDVSEIDGARCYRSFADLPERVDAVLVVVPSTNAIDVVREAAAAGIHHVWLQQGAESPELLAVCRQLGLDVVAGECVLMFAHPTSYHKAHRVISKVLGRLPLGA